MDLKTTEDHINGLLAQIGQARQAEKAFLRAQGLDEQAEKLMAESKDLEIKIESEKEKLTDLKSQRNEATNSILDQLTRAIDQLLPYGEAYAQIVDDNLLLGWIIDKIKIDHRALSGGQKVIFYQALTGALMPPGRNGVLIYEAAEVDDKGLSKLLSRIEDNITQSIVNTWYPVDHSEDAWNHIELKS